MKTNPVTVCLLLFISSYFISHAERYFWILLTSDWFDVETANSMLSDRTRHLKKKYKKIQKIRGKIIRPCRCFVWKVDRRSLRRFGAEDSLVYIESEIYPFFPFSEPRYHIQAIIKSPTHPFSARPVFHH